MHGYNDRAKFSAAFASCVRSLAASIALTSLYIATAWAGRGDIDPNYGEGGRVAIGAGVQLALPGDRLVIADWGTVDGFLVRMVDATGQKVPAFGVDGDVVIESLPFRPQAAALAPNGDMVFMGSLAVFDHRALLRLNGDGQLVLPFGNRADGILETGLDATRGAASLAVDADGRILLAEGSWNPDGSCGRTARLQRLLADGQPDAGYDSDGLTEIPNLEICNGAAVFGARANSSVIVGDGHTIVAVDAAGDIDATFGVDGRLTFTELDWAKALILPDDSLLIFGSSADAAAANDTVLLKFDRNGQPDLDFGHGTGSVTVDLGTELLGESFAREDIERLVLDPDREHVVAQLRVSHADGSLACYGIARLSIDGVPDASFGRNGLTCLNLNFDLLAVQSDGAPIFLTGYYSDSILRLLTDNSPSPGLLTDGISTGFDVGESESTATLIIERVGGRDGAVSADFTASGRHVPYRCGIASPGEGWVGETVCWSEAATVGRDFTATSGRLDWADGDDSHRTVTVRILNDDIDENTETFGVGYTEPSGGLLIFAGSLNFSILDDDDTVIDDDDTASGGGGSVSWVSALALLTLLFIRRRQNRRAAAS